MNFRRLILICALPAVAIGLVLAGVLYVPATRADDDHVRARELSQRGEILSLEKIAERARATHPGKLIDIDLEREHATCGSMKSSCSTIRAGCGS
jgi:uncharacterized membrane protein YkoI